jgi:hypothetical protein
MLHTVIECILSSLTTTKIWRFHTSGSTSLETYTTVCQGLLDLSSVVGGSLEVVAKKYLILCEVLVGQLGFAGIIYASLAANGHVV